MSQTPGHCGEPTEAHALPLSLSWRLELAEIARHLSDPGNPITDERVSLGRKILDDLGVRLRTGRPLNETQQRIVNISLGLWDAKHPHGEAGLYAYAAIVSRPEDVAELSIPEPEKRLRGKQNPGYQAKRLRYASLLKEADTLLQESGDLYQRITQRHEAIGKALFDIHGAHRRGEPMPEDFFYQPLIQAVRSGLSCRTCTGKGG